MTYSYTQISQYLQLPAPLPLPLSGRLERERHAARPCSSAAPSSRRWPPISARDDPGAVLFRGMGQPTRTAGLSIRRRDSWDRMLQQGIQLLERFAQDDRVRVRQPRKNLQIKFTSASAERQRLRRLR